MTTKSTLPDIERPLPSNPDAERSVLGAILLDNAALLVAREFIVPEDFFLSQHVHVFYEMLELASKNIPVDLVTLTEELHNAGELDAAGGAPYLAALADGMPRVSNVEHYARIVKEKSILRAVIHTCHQIQMRAFEGEGGSAGVLDLARANLGMLDEMRPGSGLVSAKIIVRDGFERIEKLFTSGQSVSGLATGYSTLDRALSGLQPAELTILAARPSIGKSAMALNITEHVAIRQGLPVAFFSLEMSRESLIYRMIASVAQVNVHKMRTGYVNKDDWRRITEGLALIAGAPLWIDDSSSSSISEIAARAERCKKDNGLKLVVVDYLQLVAAGKKYNNRQEEVSDVSRSLKALAKNLGIPVLALSQLKRPQDRDPDRAPQLSDLRESGAIEQDADVVAFLHRPNLYKKEIDEVERNFTDLIIAKQRNGPTATVSFIFRGEYTRFDERAPEGVFDYGDNNA